MLGILRQTSPATWQKSGPQGNAPAGVAQDPLADTSIPESEAAQAFAWTCPSHPHTGGPPGGHDVGMGWQLPARLPVPQEASGTLQKSLSAQGRVAAHAVGGLQVPVPKS